MTEVRLRIDRGWDQALHLPFFNLRTIFFEIKEIVIMARPLRIEF